MKWQGRPQSTNIEWGPLASVQDKTRKYRSVENSRLRNGTGNSDGMTVPPKPSQYQPTYDQTFNPTPTASNSPPLTSPYITSKDLTN